MKIFLGGRGCSIEFGSVHVGDGIPVLRSSSPSCLAGHAQIDDDYWVSKASRHEWLRELQKASKRTATCVKNPSFLPHDSWQCNQQILCYCICLSFPLLILLTEARRCKVISYNLGFSEFTIFTLQRFQPRFPPDLVWLDQTLNCGCDREHKKRQLMN